MYQYVDVGAVSDKKPNRRQPWINVEQDQWHQAVFLSKGVTSSNWNISELLAICDGNSPVTREFPSRRSVTWSFDVFFDLRLNKRLSKQSWGWWFETPSRPLWRHCNVIHLGSSHFFSLANWVTAKFDHVGWSQWDQRWTTSEGGLTLNPIGIKGYFGCAIVHFTHTMTK